MSFGLSRGKELDTSGVGTEQRDLPALPEDIATNPEGARLDFRTWFAHPERRFEIEIGSGKGPFLVQQAALEPETNFLGMEWAGEFYRYAADRIRRNNLQNVRMLRADATEIFRHRIPSGAVDVVHLYFSDPWPKKRHHKRRVVQVEFLEQCRERGMRVFEGRAVAPGRNIPFLPILEVFRSYFGVTGEDDDKAARVKIGVTIRRS